MLNQPLADAFRKTLAGSLTGALVVTHGEQTLRYYFENGQLLLLDFVEDKERLLARQYRLYHKIGAEIEMVVAQQWDQQGQRVQDYLLNQQLVTAEEVDAVTRTLVEDALCDCFGTPHDTIEWDDNAIVESFDTERSAVKLRIQVDMLLRMVESRIAERDRVRAEINDYDQRFSLEEGAPDPSALNDMERGVLHFVDGRKTVEEIATALRESNLNTACYLVSLRLQGFIREASGTTRHHTSKPISNSYAKAAQATTAPAAPETAPTQAPQSLQTTAEVTQPQAPAVETSNEPTKPDFSVYRSPVNNPAVPGQIIGGGPRRASRAALFILFPVLIVVIGTALLVASQNRIDREVADIHRDIQVAVDSSQWASAEEAITRARETLGNDRAGQQAFEAFITKLTADIQADLAAIAAALDSDQLDEAQRLLERLPEDNIAPSLWDGERLGAATSLRDRLEDELIAREDLVIRLSDTITRRLQTNDISAALSLADEAPDFAEESIQRALTSWRLDILDDISNPALPLGDRRALIDLLRNSRPDPTDLAAIENKASEIESAATAIQEEIAALRERVAEGDIEVEDAAILSLRQRAQGSGLEGDLEAIQAVRDGLRRHLDELAVAHAGVVARSRDAAELQAISAEVEQLLANHPRLPEQAQWQAASRLGAAVIPTISAATIAEELEALRALAQSQTWPEHLARALSSRRSSVASIETAAQTILDEAVASESDGRLDDARSMLNEIIANTAWSRTEAQSLATEQLSALESRLSARRIELQALTSAMLADDADQVAQLLRQGVDDLPLAIHTVPQGATVTRGGVALGVTPLVVQPDANIDDEVTIMVALSGYYPVTLDTTNATGGWRIEQVLERSPSLDHRLPSSTTSAAAGLQGAVWLTGSRGTYSLRPDGTEAFYPAEGAGGVVTRPFTNPVYAPATEIDGAVYVATRDRFCLRISNGNLERLIQPEGTDFAPIRYVSPNILDREILIVANREGRLVGADAHNPETPWRSSLGAPFAGAPSLVEDTVLAVRGDGTLLAVIADNGEIVTERFLSQNVIAAWATETGLTGYTATHWFTWDGSEPVTGQLPRPIKLAGQGLILTQENRLLHAVEVTTEDETTGVTSSRIDWEEIGLVELDYQATAEPLWWNGHAVMVSGNELRVMGPQSFNVVSQADILQPAILDGHLVVADTSGRVMLYAP